eukprot:gene4798-6725_t
MQTLIFVIILSILLQLYGWDANLVIKSLVNKTPHLVNLCDLLSKNPKLFSTYRNVGIAALSCGIYCAPLPSIAADNNTPQFGLMKGRLMRCKPKSNCISSTSVNSLEKYGRPWEFSTTSSEMFNRLMNVIKSDSGLQIVESDLNSLYIRAEGKSTFPPNGIDDVEFLINDVDKIVAYRSNSREIISAGSEIVTDGGNNRNRMNNLKSKLGLREMGLSTEDEEFIKAKEKSLFFQRLREASKPSEINFIDNSVPETSGTKE